MRSKMLIAIMVGTAFIFVASSSLSAGNRLPSPPSDACALLTQAQVTAVVGASVGTGERMVPSTASICAWKDQPGGRKKSW